MEVLDGFEFQIVIERTGSPDNLPITLSVFYRIAGLRICLTVYEARQPPTMGCSPHVRLWGTFAQNCYETIDCYCRQQAYVAMEGREALSG